MAQIPSDALCDLVDALGRSSKAIADMALDFSDSDKCLGCTSVWSKSFLLLLTACRLFLLEQKSGFTKQRHEVGK